MREKIMKSKYFFVYFQNIVDSSPSALYEVVGGVVSLVGYGNWAEREPPVLKTYFKGEEDLKRVVEADWNCRIIELSKPEDIMKLKLILKLTK
jgi:hypothetical protein